MPVPTAAPIPTTAIIITNMKKQKKERAKLRRFTLLVPPTEKTISNIKPMIGIENKNSYPKYPHIEIGL